MTEYEMTDIIMSRFSNMTEQASLYFALVSGYLLSAFTIPMALAAIPGGWLADRLGYRWSAALDCGCGPAP